MRNSHLVIAAVALTSAGSALLATSFSLAPAIVTLAAVLGVNAIVARGPVGELLAREVEWRWLLTCLLVGLLLDMLGGEGHFFFAKDDWLYRDAVLSDIVDRWLPVFYTDASGVFMLRAPLGMYLLPAAVGYFLGLSAAHVALLVQNSIILGFFFYMATLVWPRRRLVFVLLFVLFSGLDVIPVLLKTGGRSLLVNLAFWVDSWQYSSNVSQLFWSPNHVLPGWWFAALCLLYLRDEIDLAALAAASSPLVLWSPLTLASGVAIFAFFALRAPRQAFTLRFGGACCAALGLAPILAYLAIDAENVPHQWLVFDKGFFDDYSVFILFALTQVGVLAFFCRRIEPWFRTTLWASVALLLAIPAYSVGYMNDFSQRVPIIPRTFLAFGFDALVIDLLTSGALLALTAPLLVVMIGAVTPALEFYDTLSTPRFAPSDCNLLSVHMKLHPRNYLSTYLARRDAIPSWLASAEPQQAPLAAEERLCWPGRIYGEKLFNWLKPENRIWLRAPTAQDLNGAPTGK